MRICAGTSHKARIAGSGHDHRAIVVPAFVTGIGQPNAPIAVYNMAPCFSTGRNHT
jgi:hypothetical protein